MNDDRPTVPAPAQTFEEIKLETRQEWARKWAEALRLLGDEKALEDANILDKAG